MEYLGWNPWHGCHRKSEGCKNCWLYRMDANHDVDASIIKRSKTRFDLPLKKDRQGQYKFKSGAEVGTCFASDFFLEEADGWRQEAFDVIRARPDLNFLIPTKRIERAHSLMPLDWGQGWDNVIVAVSVENQKRAEERIPPLLELPLKHRGVLAAPLLESLDLEKWLRKAPFDFVSVAGESCKDARECRFEWVADLRRQCIACDVPFKYHQTGSNFIKDGRRYRIPRSKEYEQARRAFKDEP